MRILLVCLFVASLAAACGPKLFPKCGEPGVNCPPCSGHEVYPDPCAAAPRDAGADR